MVEPWTRIGDRLPTVGCTRLCQRVKPRQMALVAAMSRLLLIQLLNSTACHVASRREPLESFEFSNTVFCSSYSC